jgi:EAL domain-containing protein (putative c-di-GMP-specific phosphodiesterase class I)
VLMEDVEATAEVLRELKAMGLRLAVDDFGTGYSSLSYLMQFPIDALKVDQSFVRDISRNREGSPIITAVISMGKSLKHRVIAEGIETPEQVAFLQEQQCEEGQGFHFSRPLVADQFAALLTPM